MKRTLRIYSGNHFHIYQRAVLAIVIMLYITSPVVTYVTGNLYLLTTFFQFLLPLLPTPGNHKPDLVFCEFVIDFVVLCFYI